MIFILMATPPPYLSPLPLQAALPICPAPYPEGDAPANTPVRDPPSDLGSIPARSSASQQVSSRGRWAGHGLACSPGDPKSTRLNSRHLVISHSCFRLSIHKLSRHCSL